MTRDFTGLCLKVRSLLLMLYPTCSFNQFMVSSHVSNFEKFLKKAGLRLNTPIPVRFVGKRGLSLMGLEALMRQNLSPNGSGWLLLQVGANDIGFLSARAWRQELESALMFVRARCPGYTLVWTDMFPRVYYRHLNNKFAGIKKRRRLQRNGRKMVRDEDGLVLKHQMSYRALSHDGVHLHLKGNYHFKLCLEKFIKKITTPGYQQ